MLKSIHDIMDHKLQATDGELGRVIDCYFDDHTWTVRYLVADTGRWLPGRRVFISPQSVKQPVGDQRVLSVSLTMQQIKDAPGIETDLPVSRQFEVELAGYYGWVPYWAAIGAPPGAGAYEANPLLTPDGTGANPRGDPHLRAVGEVTGYRIEATDGDIGHVEDFIVQTAEWVIRYLVVDTRNWLPGKKVLVSPAWAQRVDWQLRRVHIDLERQDIRDSPAFNPDATLNKEYEAKLHDYYGRSKYWE